MSRSSDPRTPSPYERGPKRTGPIGTILPGDDLEVARDIQRLWEWHYRLRREFTNFRSTTGAALLSGGTAPGYDSRMRDKNDLLVYYPMQDAAGSTIVDVAPSGGYIDDQSSAAYQVTGPGADLVYGVDFDGSTDWFADGGGHDPAIAIGTPDRLLFTSSDTKQTVEFWLKPNATQTGGSLTASIVENYYGSFGTTNGWSIGIDASLKIQAVTTNGAADAADTCAVALNAGVWTHVAVTLDYSTGVISYYYNGTLVDTGSFTAYNNSASYAPTFRIGKHLHSNGVSNYFYKGALAGVAVIARVLDATEILEDYQAEPGLVTTIGPGTVGSPNAINSGTSRADTVLAADGTGGTRFQEPIPSLAADPTLTAADAGYIYFNTGSLKLNRWDGAAWKRTVAFT